jgi:hypothetical protein
MFRGLVRQSAIMAQVIAMQRHMASAKASAGFGAPRHARSIPIRSASVVAALAALLTSGCSQPVQTPLPILPERAVSVSIVQLAQSTPEWSSVGDLDLVNRLTANRIEPVPAPTLTGESSERAYLGIASTPAASAALTQQTQSALREAASKAATAVDERLSAEEARLLKDREIQESRELAAAVETVRSQATQAYLASMQARMTPEAQRRLSLELQIAALRVDADPANRSVAPDDRWGKLLRDRLAKLAAIPSAQESVELAGEREIEEQVASARSRLESESSSRLAAYKTDLDNRRNEVVARQNAALDREHADLLRVSAQLNSDLNRRLDEPLDQGAFPASAIGGLTEGALPAMTSSEYPNPMLSASAWSIN